MTTTQARIGYGSKFAISTDNGATFTEIAEVTDITPPSDALDTVDATHMQSPNGDREFILGLNDPGECSFTINFVPGSAGDTLLASVKAAKVAVPCQMTFPNGITWTFTGLLTKYAATVPLADKMSATVTFKVSGSYVTGAEAAPVNSVLPAISGLAEVGQVLTVFDGTWSGAPAFTYQWKRAATNIAGATQKTYTAVVGDEGDALTCTVTGTNSAGTASATSAPTVNVTA